jgi:phage-related protein (TIGR01555 family)
MVTKNKKISIRKNDSLSKRNELPAGAQNRIDGWVNALTGVGVMNKDKKLAAYAEAVILDMATLGALYQSSSIAARIIDRPVEEMLRAGYKITSKDITEEKLEQLRLEMEYKKVDSKIEEAMKLARLYGGSAIFVGINDGGNPFDPVQYDKIQSIDYLITLDRYELTADSIIDKDVRSDNFGWPLFYRINSSDTSVSNQKIHYSRLIKFFGVKHNRRISTFFNYWGDSLLSRVYNSLRNYNTSHDTVPNIITEYVLKVIKMVDLPEIISQGDDAALMKRLQLVSMTTSILNTIIIRAEEEVINQSTNVSGLKEIIETVDNALLADTDIPHTILFNDSAGGLGSTGESERVSWYNYISGLQESQLRPELLKIVELFVSSKAGAIKDSNVDFSVEFNPLWMPSEKETAETRKITSETDANYIDRGVLDPLEVAESRFGSGQFSSETTIDIASREKLEIPDDVNEPDEN